MARQTQFGRVFKRKTQQPNGPRSESGPWWIEYYANGKQFRESSKSFRYNDGVALLKKRHVELANGTLNTRASERITVADLLDDLKLDFEINRKSSEWLGYVDGHLRPFFGSMRASAVTTGHVQQYMSKRRADGVSNATINRELGRLHRAFTLGMDSTPPKVTRVPKIPKLEENNVRKGFFERDDFVRLRSELPIHLKPLVTFAFETGCRKGEILGLRWDQVDLIERIIRLEPGETKNDEGRTIPIMSDELFKMLVEQKKLRDDQWPACPWVFSFRGGQIKDFRGAWDEASKRAGLVDLNGKPLRVFHDLRRTGVRNIIRAGVPERVAMMISGHKTRSMLDRYNIVSEGDLLEAAKKVRTYLQSREPRVNKDNLRTIPSRTESDSAKEAANLLKDWCGREDLNLHEIAPASTSS
jgi:integrase